MILTSIILGDSIRLNIIVQMNKLFAYRNPLYWDACIKTIKYFEIDALLNTLFGHFWITVFMPHLKPENIGLNAAFNIEILINLIKSS